MSRRRIPLATLTDSLGWCEHPQSWPHLLGADCRSEVGSTTELWVPGSAFWTQHVAEKRAPRTAVVWLGANDALRGQRIATWVPEVLAIVDGLQRLGVRRVLWLTVPRFPRVAHQREGDRYRAQLLVLGWARGFGLLDTYPIVHDRERHYLDDGVHLSDLAHERVAEAVRHALKHWG